MTISADPETIRGACGHDCPDTCHWMVEVRDGVADRLYGNPSHPFTRGTLCAKVNHYLERVYHPDRVLYLALNRPAIPPRGESVSNTELFRRLAGALGRGQPWLFESDESMLRGALTSSHPWLEGITYERLWNDGYARLNTPANWRPFANGGFPTRSGKAELYSEPLREQGHDPLPSDGDIPEHPGLQLISGKALHFLNSGYSNIDSLRRRAGDLFIQIHPDDAVRRHLTAGDAVRVWNDRGEVSAVCAVSDRVRPGVAWMPFGGCLDGSGARRSVNALTAEEPTDWGGGSGLYDAFVEVEPA